MYENHSVFQRVADTLEGFPASVSDHRGLELGTFDDEFAGGGARLHFRTADALGHGVVDVELSSGDSQRREIADFVVPVEAAAVDRFVVAVRQLTVIAGARTALETEE